MKIHLQIHLSNHPGKSNDSDSIFVDHYLVIDDSVSNATNFKWFVERTIKEGFFMTDLDWINPNRIERIWAA